MRIEYNGHAMEFSDEGAKEFREIVCSDLNRMVPIYIKQELGGKALIATAEELRQAIITGASEEMAMFGFVFKD